MVVFIVSVNGDVVPINGIDNPEMSEIACLKSKIEYLTNEIKECDEIIDELEAENDGLVKENDRLCRLSGRLKYFMTKNSKYLND